VILLEYLAKELEKNGFSVFTNTVSGSVFVELHLLEYSIMIKKTHYQGSAYYSMLQCEKERMHAPTAHIAVEKMQETPMCLIGIVLNRVAKREIPHYIHASKTGVILGYVNYEIEGILEDNVIKFKEKDWNDNGHKMLVYPSNPNAADVIIEELNKTPKNLKPYRL